METFLANRRFPKTEMSESSPKSFLNSLPDIASEISKLFYFVFFFRDLYVWLESNQNLCVFNNNYFLPISVCSAVQKFKHSMITLLNP